MRASPDSPQPCRPRVMGHPPPAAPVPPIGDAERRQSLRDTLSLAPQNEDLRVFAYGSLAWNPCFDWTSKRPATLRHYHRSFSIWTVHARGTPEKPGLGLALEPRRDAACGGILFTLSAGAGEAELIPLWEREMWTRIYQPKWLVVEAEGDVFPTLVFVVSPDEPQYAGDLPRAESSRLIASATGKFGSCRDYLADTVRALEEAGIPDPGLEALLGEVDSDRSVRRGLHFVRRHAQLNEQPGWFAGLPDGKRKGERSD